MNLHESETELATLLEMVENSADSPDDAVAEHCAEIEQYIAGAMDKRDRVASYIAHLKGQDSVLAAEIKRLTDRRRAFANRAESLQAFVLEVIKRLPRDAKGALSKLEGNTSTLRAQKNPAALEIVDEEAIPASYLVVIPERTIPASNEVNRAAVAAALKAGQVVPGARLAEESYHLRIS